MDGPHIEIGLKDPGNMQGMLPLPTDGTVHPDSSGFVWFHARITENLAPIRQAVMGISGRSVTSHVSDVPEDDINLLWSTRYLADKTRETVTVIAIDSVGRTETKIVNVTLVK